MNVQCALSQCTLWKEVHVTVTVILALKCEQKDWWVYHLIKHLLLFCPWLCSTQLMRPSIDVIGHIFYYTLVSHSFGIMVCRFCLVRGLRLSITWLHCASVVNAVYTEYMCVCVCFSHFPKLFIVLFSSTWQSKGLTNWRLSMRLQSAFMLLTWTRDLAMTSTCHQE